jgi:hypothetical protein
MPEAFVDERCGPWRALLLIGRESRPGVPESCFRRDIRLNGDGAGPRRRSGALPARSHNARAAGCGGQRNAHVTLVWRVAQIHFASGRRADGAISGAGMLPFWLTAPFIIHALPRASRSHDPPCLP